MWVVVTNLKAYALATDLAIAIGEEVRGWAKFDLWTVGIQLLRSADSIGANIAEGVGRETASDQKRFLIIARGSLYETEHWIELGRQRGLIAKDAWTPETNELGRVLSGLIRSRTPG